MCDHECVVDIATCGKDYYAWTTKDGTHAANVS